MHSEHAKLARWMRHLTGHYPNEAGVHLRWDGRRSAVKEEPRCSAAVLSKHKIDKRLHPSSLNTERDDQPETRPFLACPGNRMRPEGNEPRSFDGSDLRLHEARPASSYRVGQPVVEFLGLRSSLEDPDSRGP